MNQRCHSHHNHTHGNHPHGPSSFWIHDSVKIFREIQLQEGMCFLDLGCGTGDYALQAANIVGDPGLVYALDRWEQMITNLSQKASSQGVKNIKAMVADITAVFPIANQCVDICFIATVLHTLNLKKDGNSVFNEIYRVLRPGGHLAIIECKKEQQMFGPPQEMRLSPEELEAAITPLGFEIINTVDLGNNYLTHFRVNKEIAVSV